jgi:putative transposase
VDAKYDGPRVVARQAIDEVGEVLERLVRDGARMMLERALEAELAEFLGRERYQRGGEFRGYRNGKGRAREVAVGTWSVPVQAPRASDVPAEAGRFESKILPKYRRLSRETQRLFCRLYLEGLSSGDFEPVFRQLLGDKAPLSTNTILRLKAEWELEYETWRRRPLEDEYVYLWCDGIYLDAGLEKEHSCVLTIVGARTDGSKELVAMELGYRESKESWAGVLRGLRERGLANPQLLIGDGNLGIWAALAEVFPGCRRQRCWNHRALNVEDKLPKRLQPAVRNRLHELYEAPSRAECEANRDALVVWLRQEGQGPAAETVLRDWEDFVTFYDFPLEHWTHLRTTNPIESIFAGVRLRTDVAKRARRRENALYLVFKLVQRLGLNWRALNGGANLMALVRAGAVFNDGALQQNEGKEVAAA